MKFHELVDISRAILADFVWIGYISVLIISALAFRAFDGSVWQRVLRSVRYGVVVTFVSICWAYVWWGRHFYAWNWWNPWSDLLGLLVCLAVGVKILLGYQRADRRRERFILIGSVSSIVAYVIAITAQQSHQSHATSIVGAYALGEVSRFLR